MDVRQFEYFLQICNDKSIPVAADNLYITQQALRKSIKRLEIEVGAPLFFKTGDSLVPTKAGECVKAHARNIIEEYDRLETALKSMHLSDAMVVPIASSYGVYPRVAEKVFVPFQNAHQEIQLHIVESQDLYVEDYIKNNDVELGFCIGPNDNSYFDVIPIEKHHVVAMVSRTNPLSQRESIKIEELVGQPIGIVNRNFRLYHNFMDACSSHDISPTIALLGGDVISVHNFSRFGNNVSITVDYLANDLAFAEQVVIPIEEPNLSWDIQMLVRKGSTPSKSAASFIDYVKANFKVR